MNYIEYRPSPILQKYINCFWTLTSARNASRELEWDRTLPDGSLEMVFHLGDPMLRKTLHGEQQQEEQSILIGQVREPYLFAATGTVQMLGVRFFPQTGYLFFEDTVEPFNDQAVDLQMLLHKKWRGLLRQIQRQHNYSTAITLLESFFLDKLKSLNLDSKDRYFFHACKGVLQSGGRAAIADISRDIGISNRYLEKLFRQKMGITPKLFARIIRFQHTHQYLEQHPGSLTTAAHEAGYFDQAHFIRDFKQFTGLTPSRYLSEQHPMTRHFIHPDNSSYLYNFR